MKSAYLLFALILASPLVAAPQIDLLPMYGGYQKTAAQKSADERFISYNREAFHGIKLDPKNELMSQKHAELEQLLQSEGRREQEPK